MTLLWRKIGEEEKVKKKNITKQNKNNDPNPTSK